MKYGRLIAVCGVMTALSAAFSALERLLPVFILIPLPGVKLGLANIVTLVALFTLGGLPAFCILTARCLLGWFFGGGVTGLLFSLTGGFFALGVMRLLKRFCAGGRADTAENKGFFSLYGVSMAGAAAHNIGQICAAMVLLRSFALLGYLPVLLIASIATGLITGTMAGGVLKRLRGSKQV